MIDGADQVTRELDLLKGGGGSLLREKLVALAGRHRLIVVERPKLVDRLGDGFPVPVEVVRYGWADTRRRLLGLVGTATRRLTADGQPVVTEEGHHLLDCTLPQGEHAPLADAIKATVGVVEHGLFLGIADELLVGDANGEVETLDGT